MAELTLELLAEQLKQVQSENAELKEKLSELASTGAVEAAQDEAPKIPSETFTSGKKKYKFLVPKFLHPKKGTLTALEALTDKEVLDGLVKSESNLIEEVKA